MNLPARIRRVRRQGRNIARLRRLDAERQAGDIMAYRIMVVEGEYWTAMDMATELEHRGAVVTGPLASVSEAVTLLCGKDRPDAAILDVNLRGMEVFVLADILKAQHIPFVFATGYDKTIMPPRFADVPHFEKPMVVSGCIEVALALAADRTAAEPPASG